MLALFPETNMGLADDFVAEALKDLTAEEWVE